MDLLIVGNNEWVNQNLICSLLDMGCGEIKLGLHSNDKNKYSKFGSKIKMVEFDYKKPETFKSALQNVNKIFMSCDPADLHANETIQPFLQTIKHGGQSSQIQKLIYLSTLATEEGLPTIKCEEQISLLGMKYIILRPTCFLDNFATHMKESIKRGELYSSCGNGRTAWVASEDVSKCAAILLTNDEKFKLYQHKIVPMTNSKTLSLQDIIDIFNEQLHKKIHITEVTAKQFDDNMVKIGQPKDSSKFVTLVNVAIEKGHLDQVDVALEDIIGHKPLSADQYISSNLSIWK
ncbi:hypothetical protein DICPUDRAFT_93186 [Dictyostelium purpureum]|uniref:NAD(P)-binding domain-containing protein n=1 Tax=Dictyostelium purpureum TaxID=5786 RepID=F1A3M7_DICPU|nr:uncharacterized protein DICPUDRAFT_93186 [Dictyostelium purpureum]EGC29200.1 hypothetical protein DICPUDRAFT_93186 [Dictyostelium purpureum]|eukprot:XP_003294271.1 hypothetical protein DICPUDRAFT_93186 [Dictyostelium purpureum]